MTSMPRNQRRNNKASWIFKDGSNSTRKMNKTKKHGWTAWRHLIQDSFQVLLIVLNDLRSHSLTRQMAQLRHLNEYPWNLLKMSSWMKNLLLKSELYVSCTADGLQKRRLSLSLRSPSKKLIQITSSLNVSRCPLPTFRKEFPNS